MSSIHRATTALVRHVVSRKAAGAILATALMLASCRPNEVVTRVPADHARLQAIGTIYAYAAAELKRPPASAEELLPVFEKTSISDPDKTLISTRDGQPFVILWGLDITGRYAGTPTPLAHERRGLDGVRLMITCGQQVREVSEQEFARLAWPEGYEPEG